MYPGRCFAAESSIETTLESYRVGGNFGAAVDHPFDDRIKAIADLYRWSSMEHRAPTYLRPISRRSAGALMGILLSCSGV